MDCSPPGSSVHGILQARMLSRLSFPSPGDLSDPKFKPASLELESRFFTTEPPGKPQDYVIHVTSFQLCLPFGGPYGPVLLPGKSHGWRSLVGCSPWGRWGLDMTEWLHFHFSLSCIGEGNGNALFFPGESQGRGSLVGCRLWGCTELDTTEVT